VDGDDVGHHDVLDLPGQSDLPSILHAGFVDVEELNNADQLFARIPDRQALIALRLDHFIRVLQCVIRRQRRDVFDHHVSDDHLRASLLTLS
jgi:hypothetical protein